MEVFILLPTQLFRNIHHLKNKKVYLLEEPYYFTRLNFHRLKLAYHRATMKKYYDDLVKKKIKIEYVNFNNVDKTLEDIKKRYQSNNISYYHPIDIEVYQKFNKLFKNANILPTLNYTFNHQDINTKFVKKFYKNNKFYHDEFYKFQRQKLNILMKDDKPVKGQYSFDKDNRKPFPKNIESQFEIKKINNKYTQEAISYIKNKKEFKSNYGSLDNFIYPISHTSSRNWLKKFLKERLENFGPYQDAVSPELPFGFHSVISPMMNIGLITDTEVLEISQEYYQKNKNKIPINSYEGFIRQVIGWRNYVYLIYMSTEYDKIYQLKLGLTSMRKMNRLNHRNKIDKKEYLAFWEGKTGMKPIDDIIKKIVDYGYSHHIERLMYLGNFLLINQYHPDETYRLFMEWTVDSYDWVMIPNVYGMSQSATEMMMTRIYFTSSNYITKMSTYKKSKDETWTEKWDAIYYHFINRHQKLLEKNYATSRQVIHWKKKSKSEQKDLLKNAESYFNKLNKN